MLSLHQKYCASLFSSMRTIAPVVIDDRNEDGLPVGRLKRRR